VILAWAQLQLYGGQHLAFRFSDEQWILIGN
jgi:hypothetical protein